MNKWKKLANSVKLRLALNLADVDPVTAKAAAEEAIASGVMTATTDSYSFVHDGVTFTNPVFDNLVASNRDDFVPSNILVDVMNANNDPRRDVWFTKQKDGKYVGGVYGTKNPYANFSHVADSFKKAVTPSNLLSYSEVLFMQAEGAARGFNMGGTAESLYAKAITESMTEYGLDTAKATDYIAAHPYDAANCEKIYWNRGMDSECINRAFAAWNFVRRLDFQLLRTLLTLIRKEFRYNDFKDGDKKTDSGSDYGDYSAEIPVRGRFHGSYFSLVKQARENPDALGQELGEELIAYRLYQLLSGQNLGDDLGSLSAKAETIMVEVFLSEYQQTFTLVTDKIGLVTIMRFDQEYKKQIEELKAQGLTEEEAKKQAPIILEAQKMLLDWENGDEKVRQLWEMMNGWVYKGFNASYARMGVDFDQRQYESNTYILGKDLIQEDWIKAFYSVKMTVPYG
ncbi:hypothetical protein FQR65_LT19359 [Abscondita terminalis]|nr:hypothetical protein FQR65_LT19359 [Abscondita terminalis]